MYKGRGGCHWYFPSPKSELCDIDAWWDWNLVQQKAQALNPLNFKNRWTQTTNIKGDFVIYLYKI